MRSTSRELQSAEAPVTDYVERARELGPELAASAEEIERRRELPEPIVEALWWHRQYEDDTAHAWLRRLIVETARRL